MSKKTSSALPGALARARSLASEMGAVTDELNRSIAEAEKAIAELKLGVTASVTIESDENEATGVSWWRDLSFGKEKQVWRLLLETSVDGEMEDSSPLVNASRAIRLQAVDRFPELVEKLIETAGKEVEQVKAKTEAVNNLIATLRGTDPSSDDIPF
jgi:hypothetical protein